MSSDFFDKLYAVVTDEVNLKTGSKLQANEIIKEQMNIIKTMNKVVEETVHQMLYGIYYANLLKTSNKEKKMANYKITLKDTSSNEVISFIEEYDIEGSERLKDYSLKYKWKKGNMSCDCNRAPYFHYEAPCGHDKFELLGIKRVDNEVDNGASN